ncbi:U-box domain-containing protein 32 isoform X2 [Tripterygium wilfordii]|uniref:U-box domain-containing protein 32 isoform X2 n=1 Tax=Tripterygium wilfordii TaxID=458696 RepID=UPI0018F822B7|nr:U-box domain-containing protein 32 isoform X2 [Tripterygium wilfordii]
MGSIIEETEDDRDYDVEDTVFVAVGKNVEKSKATLFWALRSFAGKKICLLHVHQTTHVLPLTDGRHAADEVQEYSIDAHAFQDFERQKMLELLNEYLLILFQSGVQAEKVWIEMDSIEKGIVEVIARYNIKWLVMGAAADKYYTKKLAEIKSKKAIFVSQKAPSYCHIWFACKGFLVYTREGRNDRMEADHAFPLLLMDSAIGSNKPGHLGTESVGHSMRSSDATDEADELEGIFASFSSQCSMHSSYFSDRVVDTFETTPFLTDEVENILVQATGNSSHRPEQAIMDTKDSKKQVFEEAAKRQKDEDDAMEAKCKAKALESLCVKEMCKRKETEELLAKEKIEVEKTKNQHAEFLKELKMVQNEKQVLENQLAETHHIVKELEEKFFSAVDLLISFKEKRDAIKLQYENAIRQVKKMKRLAEVEAGNFCKSEILEFSFMEINEATNNFDPTWRIGEGKHGSLYKGFLRHVQVAIRMLPSYGSHCHFEFQKEVEVLCRVRHPNLVTLIGICPESRSLVYEYVRNGNLEDRLACRRKFPPLAWQTRACIAADLCSVLVFLHSNKPQIIHGNLKPSKILLDDNFVCKVSGFGIFLSIPQHQTAGSTVSLKSNSKDTSVYIDPEYLVTGKLTPASDIYSFGIILLQLLTGRPVSAVMKDVKCALEKEKLSAVLDCSAGNWPLELAEQLAHLAMRCCEKNHLNRPDLESGIWSVLEPMKVSCSGFLSCLAPKEHHKIPSHFVCPILQEVMKDPQIAADGFTYEAEAIRGWLKSGHSTSPMTNLKLEHCNLVPNYALYEAIQEWEQQW